MTGLCAACGLDGRINAKGMCLKCYKRAWQREDRRKHPEKWRMWVHRHMDRVMERTRRWRLANPEKNREIARAWRLKNIDKCRAKVRRWQIKYPERAVRSTLAWQAANPHMVKAQRARRRAYEASAPTNDFTAAQWAAMKARCNHRCWYCAEQTDKLTQDHVVPFRYGGAHTESNIVPACRRCNCSKKTQDVDAFDLKHGWITVETNV